MRAAAHKSSGAQALEPACRVSGGGGGPQFEFNTCMGDAACAG